jgi:hypothetical protein
LVDLNLRGAQLRLSWTLYCGAHQDCWSARDPSLSNASASSRGSTVIACSESAPVTQRYEDDSCDATVRQERQTLQKLLIGLNHVGARRLYILDPAQGERMCEREGLAMGAEGHGSSPRLTVRPMVKRCCGTAAALG